LVLQKLKIAKHQIVAQSRLLLPSPVGVQVVAIHKIIPDVILSAATAGRGTLPHPALFMPWMGLPGCPQ
jgi:hypothetical protein